MPKSQGEVVNTGGDQSRMAVCDARSVAKLVIVMIQMNLVLIPTQTTDLLSQPFPGHHLFLFVSPCLFA